MSIDRRSSTACAAAVSALLALTACGTAENATGVITPPAPPKPIAASVTIEPAVAVLTVGGSLRLSAIVKDSTGAPLAGQRIVWASNNRSVVALDTAGVLTAVGPGTSGVSATCGAIVATAVFAVASTPVDRAGQIVGRWDLLTLDHKALPVVIGRTSTGESNYAVEGHIILESDGTYRRWTVTQIAAKRDSFVFVGSYTVKAAPTPTVTLRINPGNEGLGVFANGLLSITYTDWLDWWDEIFVRSP